MNAKTRPESKSPRLAIEMIPEPLWDANLRQRLSTANWNQCKAYAKKRAGGVCGICGDVGMHGRVECHEQWEWLEERAPRVQRLVGLISLCPRCHAAIHFGRSVQHGFADTAFDQLMKVNNWTRLEAKSHADRALQTWVERSYHEWKLDLDWLKDTLGIDPDAARPVTKRQRSRDANDHGSASQLAQDEDDHGSRGIDDDSGFGPDSYFTRAMKKDD